MSESAWAIQLDGQFEHFGGNEAAAHERYWELKTLWDQDNRRDMPGLLRAWNWHQHFHPRTVSEVREKPHD